MFHPGATGAAVIGSVAAPFDPPFFKFRAPCGHDSKLRADHSELPTLQPPEKWRRVSEAGRIICKIKRAEVACIVYVKQFS